jgi:UrcA family protein
MTNILPKLALAAVAALASSTLITASAMADPVARKSAEVAYGDLDLTSRAGAAALERRVNAAARQVCDFGDERSLMARAEAEACRAEALATAEDQVAAAIGRAKVRMAATVNSSVARP